MRCEAIHCPDTDTVRFAIYPDGFDGPRIMARVSGRALRTAFGATADEAGLLDACQSHFEAIERLALQRHRDAPERAVLLEASDFGAVTVSTAPVEEIIVPPSPSSASASPREAREPRSATGSLGLCLSALALGA